MTTNSSRGLPVRARSILAGVAALACGCVGTATPVDPTGGTGGGTTITDGPRTCRPVAAPMRALTARQFDSVVADLLQDTTRPARVLQRPQSEARFDNHHEWIATDEVLLRFYVSTAEALATSAVSRQAALFPCANPAAAQEAACLEQVLDTFARRAWRHTLSDDEKTSLRGVFTTVRGLTGATWNDGLSAVLQVLLQSPQFLYVTETGVPVADAARPTSRLTPLEVATRLSLLLWGSVPDAALLDAAENGQLDTKEAIATQARRMLADPKAARGFLDFASQWLELETLEATTKDSTRFPMWNAALATAARTEMETFVTSTYGGGGSYSDLLLGREASVDAALAAIYGVTPPASGTQARTLPDTRGGVLTRVGWLATHAHPIDTSPTLRGKAVRTRMLCEEIAAPPPGVNVMLPVVTGPATLRQRLQAHLDASGTCASCHLLMDPIGFGLESYDAVGAARTTEPSGLPIDDSGELSSNGRTTRFTGGAGLSQALAQSPQANRCYLTQTYRYAQGRTESSRDRCHLDAAVASLPAETQLHDAIRRSNPRGWQ